MQSSTKRFVYVLTGWQERTASSERPAVWRFSLEETHVERRHGFGSLGELMAFLAMQTGAEERGSEGAREMEREDDEE